MPTEWGSAGAVYDLSSIGLKGFGGSSKGRTVDDGYALSDSIANNVKFAARAGDCCIFDIASASQNVPAANAHHGNSLLTSVWLVVCVLSIAFRLVAWHTAQPNTNAAQLDRESFILGYTSARSAGTRTGATLPMELLERCEQAGRLSTSKRKLLGLPEDVLG